MRCLALLAGSSLLSALALMSGCGSSSSDAGNSPDAGDDGPSAPSDASAHDSAHPDSSPPPGDAGAGGDARAEASGGMPDGPPSYTSSCTPLSKETGTASSSFHGRMDGTLAYVLPQGGSSSCNGDSSHVHLQVRMNGSIYDVAVDIGQTPGDAEFYEADMPLPDGAWSEGWHSTDGLSYPGLGLKSGQFTPEVPATLGQKIQSELANVNHISIFCKGYSQGNGCHDVHYNDGSNDGAIVIEPLSATPHILFFHFSTQTF